jgi:polyphosphate kinase
MHRNLDRRVEALVSVPSDKHVRELGDLLALAFDETTAAWHLTAEGAWERKHLDADGRPLRDLQEMMHNQARERRARKG